MPLVMPGPLIDTPSAQEFMREILDRTSAEDLTAIAGDLERKSSALRGLLLEDGVPRTLGRDELHRVLRWTFGTRRRADRIIDAVGADRLAGAIVDLLGSQADDVGERFDRFDAAVSVEADVTFDLAGELLHFVDPDRFWLWTRWMWDPRTETGALRLVTMEEVDLFGATRGATYLAVGAAVAFVDETGKAAGFTRLGPGLFGTDVFLAAVYGIYMYTVLRMRMTQEFNRLVPPLPELTRRLLGVFHTEV